MLNRYRGAIVLTFLLLFSSFSLPIQAPLPKLKVEPPLRAGAISSSSFTDSSTSITGSVGSSIFPTIPVVYGHNMTSGSVQLQLEGSKISLAETFSVASGLLNGTFNETVSYGNSIQLVSASTGPPQASQNSSTILSTTNLVGTHSYDTLELLCGFASCGEIVATGDLTLYVNTLRVEQGTSIIADDLAAGGLGAGGSTTTSTSGRNDGGGGGGHGGAGGAGGGSSGGSGGSTYGNASERGSQGGTVASTLHATANGGNGGGYIRIFANQVFVNGSIHANGADGDAGSQASSGTGAGGSGGGGGSGGSIFIQANSVSVGNGGQIKADGGDGGDGANGAQNGPGFGMYDGGDGGGGGGGGRIKILTQTAGYTNAGTVNALGGSGGSKGLKYGTGVDGIDGSAGSNGVVNTGTWSGYVTSGNITSNNGTFTTHPLQTQSTQASIAYITHNTLIPTNTSMTANYRYTLNGTGTNWSEWSQWQPLSLSGQWVPRHYWLQIEYILSRSATNSPELVSMSIQHSAWTTLTGTDFRYDGVKFEPNLVTTTLGLTTSVNDSSTSTQPQFTLDVPRGAIFSDDVHVWLQWDDGGAATPPNFESASVAGVSANLSSHHWSTPGLDIVLDATVLNQYQPIMTWKDQDGIEWKSIPVDVQMSDATTVWFEHASAPWSVQLDVHVANVVNSVILNDCGSFYTFTAISCFGSSTTHRFALSGTTLPSGSPAFTFNMSDPTFNWQDDFAPQISSIQHRKGLEQFPSMRINQTFSLFLFDAIAEDDLVVEYLGLDWEESLGFANAQVMTYHSGLKGYYLNLDTIGLDPTLNHVLNMTIRVRDINDNEVLPRPTYSLTVYPASPTVSSLSLTGPTWLSGTTEQSLWDITDAEVTILAKDAQGRSDLSVRAALTSSGSMQPNLLPLLWDAQNEGYMAIWSLQRADIGEWSLEINMAEETGLMASDTDGWRLDVDAILNFVDAYAPIITNINSPTAIEQGDEFNVGVAWTGEENEYSSGNIAILNDIGQEIANKSIISSTLKEASLVFNSTPWSPGNYSVAVYLKDDFGNWATSTFSGATHFTVLKPWLEHELSFLVEDLTIIHIQGTISSRSGTSVLTLSQDAGTWSTVLQLVDGSVDVRLSFDEYISAQANLSAQLCDINDEEHCQSWNVLLDFIDVFAIDVRGSCDVFGTNETNLEQQTLLACSLSNYGLTELQVRLVADLSEQFSTQSISIQPGETGEILLVLLSGNSSIDEKVAWTLLVSNNVGGQKVVEMGQAHAVRNGVQADNNSEVDTEETTSSSDDVNFPQLVLLVVLISGLVGGFIIHRNKAKTSKVINDLTGIDQTASLFVEEARVNSMVDEDSMTSGSPQDFAPPVVVHGPSVDSTPTSVDGNGYEWYSTHEGHWYRLAGSQAEWQAYQQD